MHPSDLNTFSSLIAFWNYQWIILSVYFSDFSKFSWKQIIWNWYHQWHLAFFHLKALNNGADEKLQPEEWQWGFPSIRGPTNSQFAETLLHQSVEKLHARCRSQEASNELRLEVILFFLSLTLPRHSKLKCLRCYVLKRMKNWTQSSNYLYLTGLKINQQKLKKRQNKTKQKAKKRHETHKKRNRRGGEGIVRSEIMMGKTILIHRIV